MSQQLLHPVERALLLALRQREGQATVSELTDEFDQSQIMRTADWLEEKELITRQQETQEKVQLTNRGKDAYGDGVPERALLQRVQKQQVPVSQLSEREKIGLAQAAKQQLATVIEKQVQLTEKGKQYLNTSLPVEKGLRKVDEGKKVDTETYAYLQERGLVTEETHVTRTLLLSKKGQSIDLETATGTTQLSTNHIQNWEDYHFLPYDMTKPVETQYPGKKHPYLQFLRRVKQQLIAMGFKEMTSPLVELEFWNFDALFQPQGHPARELHDKFEIAKPGYGTMPKEKQSYVHQVKKAHEEGIGESCGWRYRWSQKKAKRLMIRSQNTAASARALAEDTHPKLFTINRVLRPDTIDKTHFIEFYQMEGIVRGPELTLQHLLGYLEHFGKEIAGADAVTFRPSYFPFTEPSVELFIHHPQLGWIEVGGAGIFRPEVTQAFDISDTVLAWGLGIDRLAMAQLNVEDIRSLVFPHDLAYLRDSQVI